MIEARADQQSMKAIVADLWQNGEKLVKAEVELGIELGKAELGRQVADGKVALRRTAIMSGFFYAGYLTLLAALVLGLSKLMPGWVAALAVGTVSLIAGYLMLQATLSAAKKAVDPEEPSTTRPLHQASAQPAQHR